MNNKSARTNFLHHARLLRSEGKGLTIERKTFGGCTELRAMQHGTKDSVALYMGALGHMRCSVAFVRG